MHLSVSHTCNMPGPSHTSWADHRYMVSRTLNKADFVTIKQAFKASLSLHTCAITETLFPPHRAHIHSLLQGMLYREIIRVCSDTRTEHINVVMAKCINLWKLALMAYDKVATLQRTVQNVQVLRTETVRWCLFVRHIQHVWIYATANAFTWASLRSFGVDCDVIIVSFSRLMFDSRDFDVLLTVHLSIILVINQLNA